MARKAKKQTHEHRLSDTPRAQAALEAMANNIRTMRTERGLTLQHVADSVGCSIQQLGHLEKADNFPSWPVYLALCDFFFPKKKVLLAS